MSSYAKANHYFNLDEPSDSTDQLALKHYQAVIDDIEKDSRAAGAEILFTAYIKKAILLELRPDYTGSRIAYLKAVAINDVNKNIKDSLSFQLFTHLGSAYYRLNNFDSARYFLQRAEKLLLSSNSGNDKARLFNTFGVLYYDNGNYRQSKVYFNQALNIIRQQSPINNVSAVNIQTNIATAEYKLGEYTAALDLNKAILKYNVGTDYISMNLGRTNAALNRFDDALESFRKVNPAKIPGVYNEIGLAHLYLSGYDSAAWYFDRIMQLASKPGSNINPLDIGISQLYNSYLLKNKNEYIAALNCVQDAIILFSQNFKSRNIFDNPSSFTGSFAYFRMFDALKNKAGLFYLLYSRSREPQYLKAALKTYLLTLEFLTYIEKNYDTDDAKLLLKKNSREVYEEAIALCMQLHTIQPRGGYALQAFYIAESNKGSIVASNVDQLSISDKQVETNAISQRIRNLKFAIARLNLRIDMSQVKDETVPLIRERNDFEIELSRASKLLEENNVFYKAKYSNRSPSLAALQQQLNKDQALISYYVARGRVYCFIVTNKSFECINAGDAAVLGENISAWLQRLRVTESGRKFVYDGSGNAIYHQLVAVAKSRIPLIKEWIVIPDGIICQLPIESLPIGSNAVGMLESTAISYEFSSASFIRHFAATPASDYNVLSFAPFTKSAEQQNTGWNILPASLEEIGGLRGKQFEGENATRINFLNQLNKYPVIHLATHAYADIANPAGSFIAFYPTNGDTLDSRLYLEELYGLRMDSTRLVIISACETGDGSVASNEGVLSLSRGFAYAGCASSVNSLWKADDKATAFIIAKFHYFLGKGYSKSVALQQAKLEYISLHDLGKTPNYWSNLILIGEPSPLCPRENKYFWLIVVASVYLLFVIGVIIRNAIRKPGADTSDF